MERKNRVVQDAARMMLIEANIPEIFWRGAVTDVVYIMSRAQLRVNSEKTPYDLWNGKITSVKHFKVFGSSCYMKMNNDNPGKFDSQAYEGIFLGYYTKIRSYKCYNKSLGKMVECVYVRVDEELKIFNLVLKDNDHLKEVEYEIVESQALEDQDEEHAKEQESNPLSTKNPSINVQQNHPEIYIIGSVESGVKMRSKHTPRVEVAPISTIEPKNFGQASTKEG